MLNIFVWRKISLTIDNTNYVLIWPTCFVYFISFSHGPDITYTCSEKNLSVAWLISLKFFQKFYFIHEVCVWHIMYTSFENYIFFHLPAWHTRTCINEAILRLHSIHLLNIFLANYFLFLSLLVNRAINTLVGQNAKENNGDLVVFFYLRIKLLFFFKYI